HSPTLYAGMEAARPAGAPAATAAPVGTRVVRIKDRDVVFKRAPCKRASRAARPSEPSARAKEVCSGIVKRREGELKGEGRQKLAADDLVRFRAVQASGKGPSAHARREEEQAKINHIVQLKAKNLEAHNQAASWLLWGNTAEQCYDQLAEAALRANAVNSAIVKKKEKQGANSQTTRINCKGVGAAAAAQCGNVAVSVALAEAMLRAHGVDVRNPLATNAVDPCLFADADRMAQDEDDLVGVVSTTQLVYNAHPTKLGIGCIMSAAKKLAKAELEKWAISEPMGTQSYMLTAICRSVGGGYEIDVSASPSNPDRVSTRLTIAFARVWQAAWAAIVLIVYCASDSRGRPLLRASDLTDLDVQMACTLEAYGRGEVTRRARLRASQDAEQAKDQAKRSRTTHAALRRPPTEEALAEAEFDEATGLPIEDDSASIVNDYDDEGDDLTTGGGGDDDDPLSTEVSDQRVLATKRKRASKGYASASTADAHGILSW
ncbi:MAG: hypothetical protein ACKVI4_15480, partial [Actinomycetales bacterium]